MTLDENDRWVTIRPTQGNLQLHIRTWAGSGRPFVLVHGLSSNCHTWEQTAQLLALAGHQVVTVDQRGHGLSDKPNSGYDFATVCEDLLLLCNALALDAPLIAGQSWGGNVVLEFGARYPGRAGGFAFVDGGTIDLQGRPDATWERTLLELRPPTLTGMPRTVLAERIAATHPGWSATGIEATLANFETLPDGTVRPWLSLDRHLMILRAMWEQRPPMLYPLLREPVLICPSSDPHNPGWMEIKQRQLDAAQVGLERCRVHWFEQTAHDIHVERPVDLANLFLHEASEGIWATSSNGSIHL
jgi:pimeloyl-ACP methyl ester carboxylesterase